MRVRLTYRHTFSEHVMYESRELMVYVKRTLLPAPVPEEIEVELILPQDEGEVADEGVAEGEATEGATTE